MEYVGAHDLVITLYLYIVAKRVKVNIVCIENATNNVVQVMSFLFTLTLHELNISISS